MVVYNSGFGVDDQSTVFTPCMDGAIRLMNGSNTQEGRLEICVNNAWGTVCQRGFSSDEANVVCRDLGLLNGTLNGTILDTVDITTSFSFFQSYLMEYQ